MSSSRLHDLLDLAFIPRWCCVPTTRAQSVAEHSYRVAVIVQELIDRIPYAGTIHAVRWALAHDGPECRTGDLPGNLKADFPEFRDMVNWMEDYYCPWYRTERSLPTPRELLIVKLADHLETLLFISEYIARPLTDGWVIHREQKVVSDLTAEAVQRYGWTALPDIVADVLDTGAGTSAPVIMPSSPRPDAGNLAGQPSPARTPGTP